MRVSITISSHVKRLCYVFLILLPTACSNGIPSISPLDSNAVVLAFGNSLTFGTGASTAESYPAVLEGLIHRKVINAGVPGEVTSQFYAMVETIYCEGPVKSMQPTMLGP
jgi:hypothetical protein